MLNGSYIYDLETFKDAFIACFMSTDGKAGWTFEISSRKDDSLALRRFLGGVYKEKGYLIGYNNNGFDYPVLHHFLHNKGVTSNDLHLLANDIISAQNDPATKYKYRLKEDEQVIRQIDLMALNGYNSKARMVGLKAIEFNLRMDSIEDLPFKPTDSLNHEQIGKLAEYCEHDVYATFLFYLECQSQISFRFDMTTEIGKCMLNASDNDVGKAIFSQALEKNDPDCLYKKTKGGKSIKQQTKRDKINLGEVIFDYYDFHRPEFAAVKDWFASRTITETKGVFTDLPEHELGDVVKYAEMRIKKSKKIHSQEQIDELKAAFPLGWVEDTVLKSGKVSTYFYYRIADNLNVVVDGLRYDYGTGGLHGARGTTIAEESDEWVIGSYDFASYYPHLSFVNGVYPEHLGKDFCKIYKELYIRRTGYAKGTALNTGIKLALNSTYGNSNDKFSPFYDPKFTMAITVNGQLTLTMLADVLMKKFGKDVRVLTVNSDGLEFMHRRALTKDVEELCAAFAEYVGIGLEGDYYSRFIVNNINNYIAVNRKGKLKNKGLYVHKTKAVGGGATDQTVGDALEWHKNHGALIVPKAAEHEILGKGSVEDYINNHANHWDYCVMGKVPRSSSLYLKQGDTMIKTQNIVRYYAATEGYNLVKVMPPTAKQKEEGKTEDRDIGLAAGQTVLLANNISDFNFDLLDRSWYIAQARKLVDGFTYFNPEFD